MSLLSWWKLPPLTARHQKTTPIIAEKRELQKELAQTVVTFERRNYNVKKIAEQALQSMREDQ